MSFVAPHRRARLARLLIVVGLVAALVVACTPPDEPTGHRAPGETARSGSSEVGRSA